MQDATPTQVVFVAVLAPLLTAATLYAGRWVGRWLIKALTRSFADTVSDVVAPDLARLGTRLGGSIDEMREANAAEHADVKHRLEAIEAQLIDNSGRLAELERHAIRRRQTDPPREGL